MLMSTISLMCGLNLTRNYSAERQKTKKARLAKNSHVRVRRLKKQFEKGYSSNYTEEIFKVRKVVQSNPVTYKLSTLEGDYIDGRFYKQELSEVS